MSVGWFTHGRRFLQPRNAAQSADEYSVRRRRHSHRTFLRLLSGGFLLELLKPWSLFHLEDHIKRWQHRRWTFLWKRRRNWLEICASFWVFFYMKEGAGYGGNIAGLHYVDVVPPRTWFLVAPCFHCPADWAVWTLRKNKSTLQLLGFLRWVTYFYSKQ